MKLPSSLHAAFAATLCLLPLHSGTAAEILRTGDTLGICGDSITEQKLYSVFVESYLLMCQPTADVQIHQFGWSGEKAEGLLKRMKTEVLPFQSSVVTICYGMNDAGYAPLDAARQESYRKNMEGLVATFQEAGVRSIILATPSLVDSDTFDQKSKKPLSAADYNSGGLADCSRIVKEIATEKGLVFADIRTPFEKFMIAAKAKYPGYNIAPDGIHPAPAGHVAMAYALLKALGCDGEIGTITVDLKTKLVASTAGHRVIGFEDGELHLESTRYPFCFKGKPGDPMSPASALEFVPFNEELNRFRLVAKNPQSKNYKITWGDSSKTFTAADLTKGINLAAEFQDNPFSSAFQAIENAVIDQQVFETIGVKNIIHKISEVAPALPEETAAFEQINKGVIKKSQTLAATAKSQIQPVKHTVIIEPVSE